MSGLFKKVLSTALVAFVVIVSVALVFWEEPMLFLEQFVGENFIVSSIAFVVILILATVFAPVTVMPLIPSVAVYLGPLATGVLSLIGWTIGGVIAFALARSFGRPLLKRIVSLEQIEKYEKLIPEDAQFLTIVILRIVIPVDLLSYALGLTISMPLWKYTLATAIGVSWFSFAFAYLGDALYSQNLTLLMLIGGISLIIFLLGWYHVGRNKKNSNNS